MVSKGALIYDPVPSTSMSTETQSGQSVMESGADDNYMQATTNDINSREHNPTTEFSQCNTAVIPEEYCDEKIYICCEKVLNISDEKGKTKVIAHRIGRSVQGKTRPIVTKLEYESKLKIKTALKKT